MVSIDYFELPMGMIYGTMIIRLKTDLSLCMMSTRSDFTNERPPYIRQVGSFSQITAPQLIKHYITTTRYQKSSLELELFKC